MIFISNHKENVLFLDVLIFFDILAKNDIFKMISINILEILIFMDLWTTLLGLMAAIKG